MKKADFEQLQQAAEQLNWQEELYELQELEQTAEAKTFFVAFVGCYSAGKSCLINNLLGRELLPHGTTETTTVLTYLRYAEEEKACLHKIDGSTQEISLEEVGSVDQRRENWNPDELDYLEVFVNSPLLQSGMILMDTPGINTTILRHEQLLQKTLAVAARVVYVMSGTPSRVDCGLLQEMQQRGLKPACVRTHFDQVKQQEENAEQTMQADCTRLADYGVEQCYFVSNLRESPYYENLTPLQTMLTECGSNAQEELENAIRMRLYVLAERCEKELEQRIEVLGKLDQKDQSAVQEKCEELRAQIEALEQGAQAREEEIVNRLRQAQRKLDSTVTRKMEADLEESADRIARSSADRDGTIALLRAEARKQLEQLNWEIGEVGTNALQQTNEELKNTLDGLKLEATPEMMADDLITLQNRQNEEVEELQQALTLLKQNRQQLEQELQGVDLDELKEELDLAEEKLSAAQQNLSNSEPYVPVMREQRTGEKQPSEIAGDIGKLVDWALLLMPGEAVEKGINTVLKSKVVKGGIAKGLKLVSRSARKADKQKDVLYLIREIGAQSKRRKQAAEIADTASKIAVAGSKGMKTVQTGAYTQGYGEDEKPSFLDVVTVEYWAKKVGSLFDTPPRMVEDEEMASRWKRQRAELEGELREKQLKAYERKKEYNAFVSQQEEQQAKLEAMRVEEDKLEREWNRRCSQIEEENKKKALKKWHQECAAWYREQVRSELQAVLAQARKELPERIMTYQTQQLEDVKQRLEAKNEEYNALLNAPAGENRKKLEDMVRLLEGLKEEYGNA